MASKGGLGTGLSALFEDNKTNTDSGQTLRITEIEPNREQPRKNFDDESISALAESIKQHGILQPLLVRPYGSGYQIVAGERRWRAARMLGLSEVPVQIKELSDQYGLDLDPDKKVYDMLKIYSVKILIPLKKLRDTASLWNPLE